MCSSVSYGFGLDAVGYFYGILWLRFKIRVAVSGLVVMDAKILISVKSSIQSHDLVKAR